MITVSSWVENIVGKENILFPQRFQKASLLGSLNVWIVC